MASKQQSNEGGSTSGVSDVKYQKAIKQISKLISLNTTLKNDAMKIQQKFDKLQSEYDALETKYNNLKCQSKIDSTMEILPQTKLSQKFSSRGFEEDSMDITELLEKNKKIVELEGKLKEKDEKINKMKRELEEKDNQINEQRNKNLTLQQQITNIQTIKNIKIAEASEKQNLKLKKELENSQQWVKKLSNEYENLKKQFSAGSRSFVNSSSVQIYSQIQNSQDILGQFYTQRLKRFEATNIKLKKQFSRKQQKMKAEIQKLKQEKQENLKKLINLSGFLEKQHLFIERFMSKDKIESVQTY